MPNDHSVNTPPVLRLNAATKSFGAVAALIDGNIEVLPGEVHALIGENGAGKSTLIKILAGVHQADSGTLEVSGIQQQFRSVADSKAAGVSVIYQEPTLFPDLTVAENIFIGRQPVGRFGLIDRSRMWADAEALFEQLGVPVDPNRLAEGLSIADQQIIEIAKAISLDAAVLVMDEPTAALSGNEVERLFDVARRLRDQGTGIIFISHRFEEIFDLCDRVTVMRDGAYISTHAISRTNSAELVREMVGRDVDHLFPKQDAEIGGLVLDVNQLTEPGVFADINLQVRVGEIVALAGLVGAGRSEVARAIFGIDNYSSGTIKLNGTDISSGDPQAAIDAGIAMVPEDRRQQGLVMDLSVGRNVTLALRKQLASFGLISQLAENEAAADWSKRLQVKTASLAAPVRTLSGGNQQKVVLAKWLATEPRLLIIDEPTRGIDVGTKSEVHRLISALAAEGLAVLMISSELPEVLGMADRIYVMREGRITAELDRCAATQENILSAATVGNSERAT